MDLQTDDFQHEIAAAVKSYDKFVVCMEKTPDEFLKSLQSLMAKAITAFQNRAPGLRHGIALDRHVTIMLSQNEDRCAEFTSTCTRPSARSQVSAA